MGLNQVIDRSDQIFTFEIYPIRTWYYATCFNLEPKFELEKVPVRFELVVSLNPNLTEIDRPESLQMHFTSNKTWIGFTDDMWPQTYATTGKWLKYLNKFVYI